ncbi:LysR family transcriptional regulator [Nocardioides sp. NPDC051685]|uniref:LysR family transcriptional regulator n=1 Tax=Nocardioides sp. NPDC051685 TaxID=3364334 RepID=UPI003797BE2B
MTNLSGVDLNLLVAFEALLLEKNVTRAAARVGISQGAMSNTLGRLRRLLGDEVLIRVGREWHLTSRAESLRAPLERALQIVRDDILVPAPFDPRSDKRLFTVATNSSSAVIVLAPAIARIAHSAPQVTIKIVQVTEPLDSILLDPGVDILLLPDYFDVGFPGERLLTMNWTCLVDNDHPFRDSKFSLEEFLTFGHVVYEQAGVTTVALEMLARNGINVTPRVVANDFVTIPYLLEGTPYVALVQDALADRLSGTMRLRRVEPPVELPPLMINAYWHPRSQHDPGSVWLRQLLSEIAVETRSTR